MSYFFVGCARPDESGRPRQYALYNYVVGRFVVTHFDVHVLNTVRKLFSSRYQMILCDLHDAKNFRPDLVDNMCCYNWGVRNSASMQATRFPEFDQRTFACEELVERGPLDENELIWIDREYFWCACSYVTLLTNETYRLGVYNQFISEEMLALAGDSLDTSQFLDPITTLKQQIYSAFYNEFDFDKAQDRIKAAVRNYRNTRHGHNDIETLDLSIDRQ